MTGNAKTHQTQRNRLRKKLAAAGFTVAQIEQAIDRVAADQRAARRAAAPSIGAGRSRPPSPRPDPPDPARYTERAQPAPVPVAPVLDPAGDLIPVDPERARFAELVRVHGLDRARDIVYAEQPDQPPDSAFRPRYVDPLLRGPARATGDTARSVKARRGLAQWETSP
jgi:hypothetical protein